MSPSWHVYCAPGQGLLRVLAPHTTEAVNNLIKRVKRAAFGFASFENYRIRSLLYAGKPNWALLATIRPR